MVRRRDLVQARHSGTVCGQYPELEGFAVRQVLLGLIFGIHAESSMEKHSLRASWQLRRFVAVRPSHFLGSVQFAET